MNKIALVSLACLALGACSTPTQTVGTLGGVATGAAVGGPVGAVVGGGGRRGGNSAPALCSAVTSYHCRYHDRYGHVHYRCSAIPLSRFRATGLRWKPPPGDRMRGRKAILSPR